MRRFKTFQVLLCQIQGNPYIFTQESSVAPESIFEISSLFPTTIWIVNRSGVVDGLTLFPVCICTKLVSDPGERRSYPLA